TGSASRRNETAPQPLTRGKDLGMLQGALAGLAAGGVYAVLAVCLTLMSRLVRVVNFAQAAVGMFGGFCAVWFITDHGWPIWLGTIVGVLIGGLLSGLIGWVIATWLAEPTSGTRSAVTVALLLLLISLSFIMFGNKPQPFDPIIAGPAFSVLGTSVAWITVTTVSIAVVVAVAARLVLTGT